MNPQLISRTRLAGLLRVHPRTISRAIERQGLGRPTYGPNGDAMFEPKALCRGLETSQKFLRDVLTGKDAALSPKETATLLGLSLIDLFDRVKRTGEPAPAASLSAGDLRYRATKRFSRNEVMSIAAKERVLLIGRAA